MTFDEWDACVADGGCNGYKPVDEGWGQGKHPVINVNWDDVKAYAAWLSRKTGKSYRLLSEAEREYVTRAGSTTPFWWGSSITPKQANYDGTAEPYRGGGSKGEYRRRTVPVDSFEPNLWGFYNVHGNVWEWTEDCWNFSTGATPVMAVRAPHLHRLFRWSVGRGIIETSPMAYLPQARCRGKTQARAERP